MQITDLETWIKGIHDKVQEGVSLTFESGTQVGIDQSTEHANEVVPKSTRKKATASVLIGTGAAHSAGDVVSTDAGAILEFETGLPSGTGGIILDSVVSLDQNAVFSGGAGYTLYLFSAAPTAQATNEAFNLAVTDLSKYIGKITISTLSDMGDSCVITDTMHNLSFSLVDTKLYGKLVCNGAETTITGKTITINIGVAGV